MAKRKDFKAKEKRQKIIAAVGAVILLGVLAIQGPRTWAMLNPPTPEAAEVPVTPTPAPGAPVTLTPPTTAGGQPVAVAASGGLADSDPLPLPTQSQLVAFSRFSSKDPFVVQVDPDSPAATGQPTASTPAAAPAKPSAPVTVVPPASGSSPSAPTPARSSQPAPTAATISVNGVAESVSLGKDFPSAQPVFRLVSLTRKSAKIAIAGGSFASGKPTITLELGKTLTLMNTADGTRYEIRLVSVA